VKKSERKREREYERRKGRKKKIVCRVNSE
jgi:hypothetical protein